MAARGSGCGFWQKLRRAVADFDFNSPSFSMNLSRCLAQFMTACLGTCRQNVELQFAVVGDICRIGAPVWPSRFGAGCIGQ